MKGRNTTPIRIGLLILTSFIHIAYAQEETNLLVNGEFVEDGGSDHGWTFDPALGGNGTVLVEHTDRARSGFALRLSPNARNTNKDKPFGIGQMVPINEWAGRRLTIRASIKSEGAFGVVLAFALDAKGKIIGNVALRQLEIRSEFQPQQAELDVPKRSAKLLFGVVTPSTSGLVWFADLYAGLGAPVAQVARERLSAITQSPESTAPDSAVIEVNASRVLRRIPKLMFGTNVEWVRDANTLWDKSSHSPREEIVQRARDLGVSMVRYPGGGFADYYHWQDGIGPIENRPVRPYVLDSGSSRIFFGTHELVRFCRLVGAEPLLQVNVVSGSIQEAASWVAYCNRRDALERAKNGSPEPFSIRNWEIGNEQYIKPDRSLPTPSDSYLAAEEYAERFKRFASAMRAVDPDLHIGAVSGRNFGLYRLLHDENWEQTLLQRAAGQIDFLSVHNGYAPLLVTIGPPESPEDVYRAMLAFPLQVERNLKQISDDIDRYGGSNASHIGIAVTEWGPLFAFLPSNPYIDHQKTLAAGLYVASMMQTFLRTPRIEMANFFKLTEANFMGWINAPDAEPKPVYYALQMYSRHFGTNLVDTTVSGPSYSSKPIGLVMPENKVPSLDCVASLDDSGSKLYLIVVNKNLTEPISASINLSGYVPRGSAKVWLLTAPSPDANNGSDMQSAAKQKESSRNPMFRSGHPGTVIPVSRDFRTAGLHCKFRFESRSVTAIEFTRLP